MYFSSLLQADGWHDNVEVSVDSAGLITAIEPAKDRDGDLAIPGFRNAHSHAFQYAMAGIAENHSNPEDDFWSWREAMYKLALSVGPEDLESIAAMLYSEMARHGYTHVVEFHYLHHDADGIPYQNPAEMASRLFSAAEQAGINITLVPVYYKLGGFGKEPHENQKRFILGGVDEYFRLIEAASAEARKYDHAGLGIGVHSLRAAPADEIIEIASNGPNEIPFHIHISEQMREVEECVSYYGLRPVKWLLENVEVDSRFHLVHATHIDKTELKGIAGAQANVVLCPTTEANLGDGLFPLKEFKAQGGAWSIGTDSHVSLSPFEEIRMLDYGQRLESRTRNVFGEEGSFYAVKSIFDAGCRATGSATGNFFQIGEPFNACIVKNGHPIIGTASRENRLNSIVYSSDATALSGSVVNGKRAGIGVDGVVEQRFRETVRRLSNR